MAIRKNSNNLVLVSPIKWAYNLSRVVENPIRIENIGYSIHPYTIHRDWRKNFEIAVNKLALVVTEWAFKPDTSADFLRANREDYGNPLLDYMEENNIGWLAWCYDIEWGPNILNSLKKSDYTVWGRYVIQRLKG